MTKPRRPCLRCNYPDTNLTRTSVTPLRCEPPMLTPLTAVPDNSLDLAQNIILSDRNLLPSLRLSPSRCPTVSNSPLSRRTAPQVHAHGWSDEHTPRCVLQDEDGHSKVDRFQNGKTCPVENKYQHHMTGWQFALLLMSGNWNFKSKTSQKEQERKKWKLWFSVVVSSMSLNFVFCHHYEVLGSTPVLVDFFFLSEIKVIAASYVHSVISYKFMIHIQLRTTKHNNIDISWSRFFWGKLTSDSDSAHRIRSKKAPPKFFPQLFRVAKIFEQIYDKIVAVFFNFEASWG